MDLAQLVDTVPVVQSTADRGRRFPTPATDQRVYNKGTGNLERWTGSAWTTDFVASGGQLTLGGPAPYLSMSGATISGSAATDFISLTGTWNTTGAPIAFEMNITNTLSTNPYLARFRVGGQEVFSIQLLPVVNILAMTSPNGSKELWMAATNTLGEIGSVAGDWDAIAGNVNIVHFKSTGEVDIMFGPLVVGTDPTGAELLRVGSGARINGALTVLTGGLTVTGASTITGTLGGVTTLTATTLIGTLSTAAQPNVTSLGILTGLSISGSLVFTAAAGKIIPGATSLSHRNTADSADNLLIADAGAISIRGDLTWTSGALRRLGTSDAFGLTLKTNALDRWSLDTAGNLLADPTNGGTVQSRVGTSSTVAKHSQVLYTNQGLTTTSTSDVSLASFSLPANALSADGQRLRITIYALASTQNATAHVKFGATDIMNATITTANGGAILEFVVVRTGAATQRAWGYRLEGTSGVGGLRTAPAETLSGAVTIDFRGSVTAGGTLSYDAISVEYLAS